MPILQSQPDILSQNFWEWAPAICFKKLFRRRESRWCKRKWTWSTSPSADASRIHLQMQQFSKNTGWMLAGAVLITVGPGLCFGVLVLLVTKSYLTLCDPVDLSPPGSSVHWVFQARILKWVAIPFSRGSSKSRIQTQVYCIAGRFFTLWATKEALYYKHKYSYL